MNNNEKERTTFNFGESTKENNTEIDLEAIKAITLASGFRETPKTHTATSTESFRRTRRKTGRTEQFSTRLRPSTLNEIYQYADQHEITLAETIERAMASLLKNKN
ncbi:stability/partitioning determinant [Arsenophonus sp. ENCA]|uniref:hypothetical protein n=1 Tax=Arsenophonus sp. ENCA TaxID=1987579 RepID=UPI000BCF34DC|nr:hypothetical protein [Arsenophonus sp. ENCA]PAV01751.1 stability/partitioning determinant [Arsenophonus sp. ENCA]